MQSRTEQSAVSAAGLCPVEPFLGRRALCANLFGVGAKAGPGRHRAEQGQWGGRGSGRGRSRGRSRGRGSGMSRSRSRSEGGLKTKQNWDHQACVRLFNWVNSEHCSGTNSGKAAGCWETFP